MRPKAAALSLALLAAWACSGNGARDIIFASGTIEAIEVNVASKVSGEVLEIAFREGARVAPGDTLAVVDHAALAIQLRQAEAGVRLAQAQLALLVKGARSEDIRQAESLLKQAEAALGTAEPGDEAAEGDEGDDPEDEPPDEEGVAFLPVFPPGLGDLDAVADDVVEEHEDAPRADPGERDDDRDGHGDGEEDGDCPGRVVHQPLPSRPGKSHDLPEIGVLLGPPPARSVGGVHQSGQEGVEAEDEPLVEVEGPEQGLLHPAPGLAERFHELDRHRDLLFGQGIKPFPRLILRFFAATVQGPPSPAPVAKRRQIRYS